MATTRVRLHLSVRWWVVALVRGAVFSAAVLSPFGYRLDPDRVSAFVVRYGVKVSVL